MPNPTFSVVDTQGVRAVAAAEGADPSSMEVTLPGGERLSIATALIHRRADGTLAFDGSFQDCLSHVAGGQVVLPVVDEQLHVSKRTTERERVRLETLVTARTELVDVPLVREELSVERVPIGRVVAEPAAPRQEGDTLIIPVYEETIVIEKRLVLKEEVRVSRARLEHHEPQEVTLRREELVVERIGQNGSNQRM